MVRCLPAIAARIILTTCREHDADDVYVTGTFDDWKKSVQLEKEGDIFKKTVELPKTKTQYKVCHHRSAHAKGLSPGSATVALPANHMRSLSSMATGVSTRARPRKTMATASSTTFSCPRTSSTSLRTHSHRQRQHLPQLRSPALCPRRRTSRRHGQMSRFPVPSL